jgi:hypothetical protein
MDDSGVEQPVVRDAAPDAQSVSESPDAGPDATVDPDRWVVAIYGTVPPPHRPGC